ncbi:MAG: O-methyltransferase [Firmicutes bacterium]|nr:O-methyltransferase [Bacillota bacterium]
MHGGKLGLAVLLVPVAGIVFWPALQGPARMDEEALKAEFDKVRQPGMMNVPREDGEYLHDLIVEHGYKRVLEIGTSNGYSALWMGLALRKTGGRLITIEIDETRANLAAQNFRRLGFEEIIELRRGDALQLVPLVEGPLDLVFIDAWKPDYPRYLELVFEKVRAGGAIVAHNTRSHADDPGIRRYLEIVRRHPQLDTRVDTRSSAGFAISFKR